MKQLKHNLERWNMESMDKQWWINQFKNIHWSRRSSWLRNPGDTVDETIIVAPDGRAEKQQIKNYQTCKMWNNVSIID